MWLLAIPSPMLDASPTTRLKPRSPCGRTTSPTAAWTTRLQRDGLEMTFRGWTYSLQDYAMAFEQAGFVIEAIREPLPSRASERYSRWARVPMFLMVRAAKR